MTIFHGFPGGATDLIARALAEGLTKRLGQQVIVESRPGAAGTLVAGQAAHATPDGYTLLAVPSGHAVAAATYNKLPYLRGDNQDERAASIRMRMRRGWADGGRA
jgi:tripartite-type tricarboxylate transporter receptor subunit TctC